MFDYYHRKWKKKQKHILRLDKYRDRVAAMYGRAEEATTVHQYLSGRNVSGIRMV